MAVETRLISLEDFIQLYTDEGPFEWVDGERLAVPPNIPRSSRVAGRLFRMLSDHVEAHQLGEVFIETPFVVTPPAMPNWVEGSRVPDVMFVAADRLAELEAADPRWQEKPVPFPPDLVVEVISPTDRFAKVVKKIERYLADGVKLIWLINPENETVTVYERGSNQQTQLSASDTLSAGDLIPHFSIHIADLFA